LHGVKREHLARRTGASTYGVDNARTALAQAWCDVVQVEHSLVNPSVVAALSRAKQPGQEIVARSVLCKGLLTSYRHEVAHLAADAEAWLTRLERLAVQWGFTLAQLAIRFALDTPGIDVVLVGIASVADLDDAVATAARPPLAAWQLDELREFDRSHEDWTHPERWGQP
jgi:aryl-alcohol dehydrogenase-like predicted oxidoreductase